MKKLKVLGVPILALLFCCMCTNMCTAKNNEDDFQDINFADSTEDFSEPILVELTETESEDTEKEMDREDLSDPSVTVMYTECFKEINKDDSAENSFSFHNLSSKRKIALLCSIAALLIAIAFVIRYCIRK